MQASLKSHDSAQRPGVSRYGLNSLLYISWNFSFFRRDWLLEKSLAVTSDFSPIDSNCWRISLKRILTRQGNAANLYSCKTALLGHDKSNRQSSFFLWNLTFSSTLCIDLTWPIPFSPALLVWKIVYSNQICWSWEQLILLKTTKDISMWRRGLNQSECS